VASVTAITTRKGRPAIGNAINMRFPAELLAQIDAAATAAGITRSEWIRTACTEALRRSIPQF